MSTNSKLLTHIDELLAAISEIVQRGNVYRELRATRVPQIDVNQLNPQALGHWAAEMRRAFDDAYGDTFVRVAGHQDAILMVSNDEALTSPVRRATQTVTRVKIAIDDLVQDVEYVRNPQDMGGLFMRMVGATFSAVPNGPALNQAVAEIDAYRRRLRGTGTA
jgi:hypothetical protein